MQQVDRKVGLPRYSQAQQSPGLARSHIPRVWERLILTVCGHEAEHVSLLTPDFSHKWGEVAVSGAADGDIPNEVMWFEWEWPP